jgi:hypothetical protein
MTILPPSKTSILSMVDGEIALGPVDYSYLIQEALNNFFEDFDIFIQVFLFINY